MKKSNKESHWLLKESHIMEILIFCLIFIKLKFPITLALISQKFQKIYKKKIFFWAGG